ELCGDTREWKTIRRLLSTHSLVSTIHHEMKSML
ncbi:MAG: hypothetical protein ACI9A1_000409, partial [Lentimonas sp.]